jgi:hypothetical protein
MSYSRFLWTLSIPFMMSCAAEEAPSSEEAPSWLFVVNAEEAALSGDTLALTGVSPDVIAFTDRPDRGYGTLSMEELAAAWSEGSDSFADDPPNAIIDGTYTNDDGTTSRCSIDVELMAPPVAGEEGEWNWATVELYRWEGCPEGDVTLSEPAILVDGSGLRCFASSNLRYVLPKLCR